jgi:hypothetical protein
MKRTLLAAFIGATALQVQAQDLKKVETSFMLQQYENAKNDIDKAMTDPKAANSPAAWLWKAAVYAELSLDPKNKDKYPNATADAFAAYEKYKSLDPGMALIEKEKQTRTVDIIYSNYFNKGIEAFKAAKYDSALTQLVAAEKIGQDYTAKNWKKNNQVVDTFTVLYAGYAAQNGKKNDEAASYYTKLADKRIAGKDFFDVYNFLLFYYYNKKDNENFKKYLALAKEFYPTNPDVVKYEKGFNQENANFAEKVALFEKGDADGSLSLEEYLDYGILFANPPKDEAAKMDSTTKASYRSKAAKAFEKAFAKDPSNGLIAFNTGLMYYQEFSDLDDRFAASKGATPALKAKRDAIEKQQQTVAQSAIEWYSKAVTALKAKAERTNEEKSRYKASLNALYNLYEWKANKARGKVPADVDKYEKLMKEVDAQIDAAKTM